jgi:hypothetical protein
MTTTSVHNPTIAELTRELAAGHLDHRLGELKTLIDERIALTRAAKTVDDYGLGDKVVFNNMCGTRYLVGHTARVTGKKRTKLVVQLDKPTGRFMRVVNGTPMSVDITVPLAILDPA